MSVTQSEIEGAYLRLEELKKLQAFHKRLTAFVRQPEFQELIVQGYCRDEVSRFTHQSGDPRLTQEQRADALSMAHSGGHFLRWLNVGEIQLGTIERDIEQIEETLREIEAESNQ